ncbi:gliding motility-associated C-terminal domain-containing protein [Olleya sp. UBA1516]|uniref:DUF7933 domain-containing protein n=1 Tax=Olleya sp. UBA1516 TaxID=1947013 RepID=UPI0025CD9A72|nr:gliding motility-associated C-terminal domain-containing protein [Olleya sp. UBA1516]|tara:strand:+ start:30468 stop:33854 length:3387 start_codon:yes stop_codon:yes gene_type:complete
MKKSFCLIIFCFSFLISKAQTTDLSIVVAAQNLSGSSISQVNIYQDFQYIVTIFNSGGNVTNATFTQTLNPSLTVLSTNSQNQTGGASVITPITLSGNTISGTIASLPSNSSVQLKVVVKASLTPGGVATNATVFSPEGTTDNNLSNNTSVISIDIVELPINFTVDYSQITPIAGTSITDWNQAITYQFTITNSSTVPFPLQYFTSTFNNANGPLIGVPIIQLNNLTCINTTSGMSCPDTSSYTGAMTSITSSQPLFSFGTPIEFTPGGSLTFEMEVLFLEPTCAAQLANLEVSSLIELTLYPTNINQSSDNSNTITNPLPQGNLCGMADLCINTIQTNPDPLAQINWNEEVTFVTTICNMGPQDAYMRFFLQNLTFNTDWEIISINCDTTTGPVTCSDFTLIDQDQFWESSEFILPTNTTITVTTVVVFIEPDCSTQAEDDTLVNVRSGVNLLESTIIDPNIANNADSDFLLLPPLESCDPETFVKLSILKDQISPELPAGSNNSNTVSWGEITYHVVAINYGSVDSIIYLSDFINDGSPGTLVSVTCIDTTGSANCYDIVNANIGIFQDGFPEAGENDVFWEITPEENVILPAQSSITYEVVIDWQPECTINPITVRNNAIIGSVNYTNESNISDNSELVLTYMAPCIDILVQTYSEYTTVGVNSTFNWIIDITNSNTSSNATNIAFEDILGPEFTINGTPTCIVTSGIASCMSAFNISGNTISGNITNMEGGSTIQIAIPVTAPSYGGAFTNTAQAIANINENNELTPDTNLSISNMQVIAPTVLKTFTPDQIIVGQQSILEFTVFNVSGNVAQSNITFTDNLPLGLTIAGPISWTDSNGCTATFTSSLGGTFVGVSDLIIPEGVGSCSFSVLVTSTMEGIYNNNSSNFSNQNNIDSSQANATLTVLEDTTNVDIEVLKSVTPTQTSIGQEVTFTISASNIGTTEATNIMIFEKLPIGYQLITANTSFGNYDVNSFLWSISHLLPNQSESLTITAQVISSNNLLNTATLTEVLQIDRDDTNNQDWAVVTVDACLQMPKGFSPGSDMVNDTFVIPCIEDYPNNDLKIYNRYGTLIYQSNNYINDWKGMPNQGPFNQNKVLPVGTYYYVLNISTIKNPFVGYIYLNY